MFPISATINELMHANLLVVFNERDSARRSGAIARIYADDIRWTDDDGVTTGHAALDTKAAELAFNVVKPEGSTQISGFDVAIVRDGVIAELYTVLTNDPR